MYSLAGGNGPMGADIRVYKPTPLPVHLPLPPDTAEQQSGLHCCDRLSPPHAVNQSKFFLSHSHQVFSHSGERRVTNVPQITLGLFSAFSAPLCPLSLHTQLLGSTVNAPLESV